MRALLNMRAPILTHMINLTLQSQMAVLRHILFFSEGVVWDRLRSVVLKEIAALVVLVFIS